MTHGSIPWESLDMPALYRYRVPAGGQTTLPVLMVGTQSPTLWDLLGVYFMSEGFQHIYAFTLEEQAALARAIEYILAQSEAEHVILLANGRAAAAALRYVEGENETYPVRMFIGLNGEYEHNALSYLDGSFLAPALEEDDESGAARRPTEAFSPGSPDLIHRCVMLNIFGLAPTSYLNPDRSVSPLPEAVNIGMNLHPNQLIQSPEVYEALRAYLRGEVWIVQLHLRGLQMRLGAPDVPLGRFFFEVESQRVPPEAVFVPPDQTDYEFEYFTPLGTIGIPDRPGLQATDVKFRLREVGKSAPKRRSLTTRLHVPLVDGNHVDHDMQDSFGSEIRLRVHCIRAPRLIA